MAKVKRSPKKAGGKAMMMEQQALSLIEAHPHFAGRTQLFEFQYANKSLVVRGRVPTFYLKQMLQSVLKSMDGVERIDNQVTVDWNDGLIEPARNCVAGI
jgi:hypothetical protein